MSEFTLRILNGLKWWAIFFAVVFMMVVLTAPTLFGVLFIRGSAVGCVFLIAMIGFAIGFRTVKRQKY
jgi:hypothetical protein